MVDPVEPFHICERTHDEHGIMRKRDTLHVPWCPMRCSNLSCIVVFGFSISFKTEGHRPLCAEGDVDDVRSANDVDGFVGVVGDVVCAGAIELDEDVVDWMVESLVEILIIIRSGV